MNEKTYTIFAGVNGAGKTTLYTSEYHSLNKLEKRINTDEMVARLGDWKDNNLQMKCAREAVKLIKFYFENGISFNQETTLSGKSILSNIKKAKEKGYKVIMLYVYVSNSNIGIERVLKRVTKGGHGIAPELIKKRFEDSFKNLKKVISLCDEVQVYNNDDVVILVAIIQNGIIFFENPCMNKDFIH